MLFPEGVREIMRARTNLFRNYIAKLTQFSL